MKRLTWLLPLAFALMWGGVLFESGRPATAARTEPPASAESVPDEPPAAAVPPPAAPPAKAEPPGAAEPPIPTRTASVRQVPITAVRTSDGRRLSSAERVSELVARSALQSAAEAIQDAHAEADPDELLGEQGVGATTPEFVRLETDYTSEPRDGAWAIAEEQRIRSLIEKHPMSKQLALLHCQDSVCRILLEAQSKDAFEQLLSVPGLAEATGLSASSPYSLRSGQLSVYYRRADAAASKSAR